MDIYDIIAETKKVAFVNARKLRKKPTVPEQILWKILRNRKFFGFKFRRQLPLGNFVVDFCCIEKKVIVEIDGDYHNLIAQKKYDMERSAHFNTLRFKVIRFTNQEVLNNLETVLQKIKENLIG